MTVKVVQNEDDGTYSVIKHNSTTTINCRHFTNKNDAINHAIIQAKREGDTDIIIEKGDVE